MIGKAGIAPCGHRGEYVTSNYVRCLEGCEGVPERVERETTEKIVRRCMHLSTYTIKGVERCAKCEKLIRYVGKVKK